MNTKITSTLLALVIIAGAMNAIGIANPVVFRSAQAQSADDITIQTSADDNGGRFFGGMLQVIIDDDTTDDDDDSIDVKITASEDGGNEKQITSTIDDTHDGSQRFEFFLVHTDAANQDPADEDADVQKVITFGDGATDIDVPGFELYDDGQIEIQYGDETVTINYDDTSGTITLDRSVYGSDSTVHIFITDQDGNIDPTDADTFNVAQADVSELFDLSGGSFGGDITFTETGDNTAKFEADVPLSSTGIDAGSSQSLVLTLNDQIDYTDVTDNTVNDSDKTSDVSFEIDDVDGAIDDVDNLTFGSEFQLVLRDLDQNKDSEREDSIPAGAVTITSDGPGGDVVNNFKMEETDDNTGVFVPDTTNNEIKVTFVNDENGIIDNDNILQLTPDDISEDIFVDYHDPRDDDSGTTSVFTTTLDMSLTTGTVDLPDTAGINDDFPFTLTDPDLNDNPRSVDSYTFTLDGDGEFPLKRGSAELGNLATIEVQIQGENPDFADPLTYTLTETGINTGVFEADLDMADILDSSGVDIDDGDRIKVTYNDLFDNVSHESSDQLAIAQASTSIDTSRSALPIPPETDSDMADILNDNTPQVFTTLTVTDSDQNTRSNTEEGIDFCFIDDCPDGPAFEVEVNFHTSTQDDLDITAEDDGTGSHGYVGSVLEDILPGLTGLTLTETGKTTGVFSEELPFEHGTLTNREWQNLEITITYTDTSGDEESTGITFRGNDGAVTTNIDSARSGDVLTVTVQDEDLNLDDDTVEEFTSTVGTHASYILSVETEDDEIDGTTQETFRETGKDTGIFEATWTVGNDIPVTEEDDGDVSQATNILVTYNDEVDSTGGSGDEMEVNVPVVTSTGGIQITPDIVGPGTQLTVLITDQDLNEDPAGTDSYPGGSDDNGFVTFRTDRNDAGEATPKLEETGPNTGVFQFQLQLVPGENCDDDEVTDEAVGGSEPEITVCPGDLVSVKYDDEQDSNGRSTTVSKVVEVGSYDPEFASDKDSYSIGDKVTVTISDPDANRDPDIADSLTDLRVYSDTDAVGQEMSALETGKNTGVFSLNFHIADNTQSGSITVKSGDDVTVQYNDDFPADFADTEDDKDFTFSVPVGGIVGTNSTTPTNPTVKDITGGVVTEVTTGQQVVLSTTVLNNNDQPQPFAAIMEVRDANGITVYLAWQTGTLQSSGQTEVGLSWTPDNAGTYTVRTFVVSDLENPQVLSVVKTSTITVS